MARVIGPLHSEQARGALGGLCYRRSSAQNIVQTKGSATSGHSQYKDYALERLHWAHQQWFTLRPQEIQFWHETPYTLAHENWWGFIAHHIGHHLFLSINSFCRKVNRRATVIPRTDPMDMHLIDLIFHLVFNDLEITCTYMGLFPEADTYLAIVVSGPWSPGRKPDRHSAREIPPELCTQTQHFDVSNTSGVLHFWARLVDINGCRTPEIIRTIQI